MTVVDTIAITGSRNTSPRPGFLWVFDVSSPSTPTRIVAQTFSHNNVQSGRWINGEHFLALSSPTTSAYSYEPDTSLANAALIDTLTDATIGSLDSARNPSGTIVASVIDSPAALALIDTADPLNLAILGTLSLAVGSGDVSWASEGVGGETVFITENNHPNSGTHDSYIRAIDVSTPASPAIVGSYAFSSSNFGGVRSCTYVGGGILAVTTGVDAQGVLILDVSDRTAPTLLGTLDTTADATFTTRRNITRISSSLIAVAADNGLGVVDISIPASPSHVGTVWGTNMQVQDGIALDDTTGAFACYTNGLRIVDFSTPASPNETGSYLSSSWRMQAIDLYDLTVPPPSGDGDLRVGILQLN